MEGETLMFAQVMIVIVGSLAGFVGIGLGARVLWRMGSRVQPLVEATTDAAETQRIENSIEAIAIEVERISESQRYLVMLLSNRLPGQAEGSGKLPPVESHKPAITPH